MPVVIFFESTIANSNCFLLVVYLECVASVCYHDITFRQLQIVIHNLEIGIHNYTFRMQVLHKLQFIIQKSFPTVCRFDFIGLDLDSRMVDLGFVICYVPFQCFLIQLPKVPCAPRLWIWWNLGQSTRGAEPTPPCCFDPNLPPPCNTTCMTWTAHHWPHKERARETSRIRRSSELALQNSFAKKPNE